jgi:hypothetical protein
MVGIAIGSWLWLLREDAPHSLEPASGGFPPETSSLPLRSAEAGRAQRVPAPHDLTWTIVDDRGRPVAGATSRVGSSEIASDAQGRARMTSEAASLSVSASAPAHATVEASVAAEGDNVITLPRILPLTVRAVDPFDRPVADVEVIITRKAGDASSHTAGSGSKTARTRADGLAVLDDVVPGTWMLDARHEHLIYSRESQNGGRGPSAGHDGIAVLMPQDQMVTIRLVEACVIAVEVEDGSILSSSFHWDGRHMHGTSTPGGQAHLKASRALLESAHPKASIAVKLLRFPSVDLQDVEVEATVWVAGRRPWQGKLRPVLLRDFQHPVRIKLADMPESNEWGSIMVHLVGASGQELTEVPMQLMAADKKSPLFLTGRTPFRRERVVSGQLLSLPAGSWRLNLANQFLQRCADQLGAIQVESGGLREIRIGSEWEWGLCRLCAEGDAPPAAGTFVITHLDTGHAVTQLVNDIHDGVRMWLPAGRIRLEISARQLGQPPDGGRTLEGRAEGVVEAVSSGNQLLAARVAAKP